ncbi:MULTISPECIES: endonuclease domain-containing protein [unclassified Chelatococcus]|uniref:endonuclease domain-containing protein n=1 Tax=unclassified Chelatococcus TaxID=2638111 RepID=UPI0020BE1E73|nr:MULTISPECIES: endonuclease domain-containing protein [unclassified Chelatococcus]MCO5078657.1 endonuclease domain-containing protein [Chelatococcus sp.]CAH1652867.1 hypothetical protein CHELA41_20688 [Hyphomicrobiales bacterium]CAH1685864.1 hypothetical protein CHELA20_54238 [Hyphomicrobiales bacterium]
MRKAIVRARQLRANQTTPEEKLWHVLRHRKLNGRKFRRQHPIDRFIVDFPRIEAKLVVEVDGATHSTAAETLYDRNREAILTAAGFMRSCGSAMRTSMRAWSLSAKPFSPLWSVGERGNPSPAPAARPLPPGEVQGGASPGSFSTPR